MWLCPRDVPDLWPMIRHSFLFGRRPQATAQFNPLEKLVLGCLALETIQPASLARSPRRAGYGGRGTGAGYRDVPRGSALTITTTRLLGGRASGRVLIIRNCRPSGETSNCPDPSPLK